MVPIPTMNVISNSFLFLILLISCEISAQDTILVPTTYYFGSGQKSSEGFLKNGKPEGYWRAWYPDGVLRSEGNRRNFQLDSIWVFYTETGDPLQKINYFNGKKNGYMFNFEYEIKNEQKVGGLASKELYLNDVKQGISYYYDKGILIKQIPYKDGRKHGLGKEFAPDGRIIVLLEYSNDFLINRERINKLSDDGKKQGIWKEFYSNDIIKVERNYKNDTLQGFVKEFDESGKITAMQKYDKGMFVEPVKSDSLNLSSFKEEYYETGQLKYRGGFYDGKPVGMHKEYSIDGKVITGKEYNAEHILIASGQLDANEKKQGKWEYTYESGKKQAIGNFKDNKKVGTWTYYFEEGNVEQKGSYSNDKPNGTWYWYYANDSLWREETFERGKEDGSFVEYGTDGKPILKGQYVDGERDGLWYYHTGDHIEEGNYQEGLQEGLWKHYYTNGKLFFQGKFVQGQPDGKHVWYYENGSKKEEGVYILGSREKKWIKYDLEKNPYLIITYKNDLEYKINGAKINLQRDNRY